MLNKAAIRLSKLLTRLGGSALAGCCCCCSCISTEADGELEELGSAGLELSLAPLIPGLLLALFANGLIID